MPSYASDVLVFALQWKTGVPLNVRCCDLRSLTMGTTAFSGVRSASAQRSPSTAYEAPLPFVVPASLGLVSPEPPLGVEEPPEPPQAATPERCVADLHASGARRGRDGRRPGRDANAAPSPDEPTAAPDVERRGEADHFEVAQPL